MVERATSTAFVRIWGVAVLPTFGCAIEVPPVWHPLETARPIGPLGDTSRCVDVCGALGTAPAAGAQQLRSERAVGSPIISIKSGVYHSGPDG